MIYLFKRYIAKGCIVYDALKEIYGLNRGRIKIILMMVGVNEKVKVEELKEEEIEKLDKIIEDIYNLDRRLLRRHEMNIAAREKGASYKGMRLRQGLPSRGQRTHTNASTAKKRKGSSKVKNKK